MAPTNDANTEAKMVGEPVKLNVYDLTDMNGYMYWFGLGVYHSAIEGGILNPFSNMFSTKFCLFFLFSIEMID